MHIAICRAGLVMFCKNIALTLEKPEKKICLVVKLVVAPGVVYLAGNVACNTVANSLALDGGDLGNNCFVVFEVAVEGFWMLF